MDTEPMTDLPDSPVAPLTEAGRILLNALIGLGVDNDSGEALHDILAVERDAADRERRAAAEPPPAIDVDVLTSVLWNMVTPIRDWLDADTNTATLAKLIARAYAAARADR